jgi:ADP-heptose:LPS heptosyltransferase
VDNREDLDGLAALIEACDEVVSIGNATAHLAGALGKRTTVLLPEAPSWRWLAQGTTTPWYDGCTLIRKTSRLSVAELWLSAKANQP